MSVLDAPSPPSLPEGSALLVDERRRGKNDLSLKGRTSRESRSDIFGRS